VSLWNIVEQFHLGELLTQLHKLDVQFMALELRGRHAASHWIEKEWRDQIADDVEDFKEFCSMIGFKDAADKLFSTSVLLRSQAERSVLAVSNQLKNVRQEVESEANRRAFIAVEPDRVPYLDQRKLFGKAVYDSFPSARRDVVQSGNCLAAECHAASVFHLMHVAEYGLRALARDRRVKLPKKGQAVELATWEEIIKQLENEETAIQGYPKTLAREAQYEFVHGAMMQFKRFKNVFRNRVMHTREDFGRTQALGVFENVRDFMQTLAFRISETKRTPRIWKGPKWSVGPVA